jgi:hypothetical protein
MVAPDQEARRHRPDQNRLRGNDLRFRLPDLGIDGQSTDIHLPGRE